MADYKRIDENGGGALAAAIFTKMKVKTDEIETMINNIGDIPNINELTATQVQTAVDEAFSEVF